MGKIGLLEEIAQRAGCMYLSDLHEMNRYVQVQQIVRQMEYGRYSAGEWKEAYEYITGKSIEEKSEEEIRALF